MFLHTNGSSAPAGSRHGPGRDFPRLASSLPLIRSASSSFCKFVILQWFLTDVLVALILTHPPQVVLKVSGGSPAFSLSVSRGMFGFGGKCELAIRQRRIPATRTLGLGLPSGRHRTPFFALAPV